MRLASVARCKRPATIRPASIFRSSLLDWRDMPLRASGPHRRSGRRPARDGGSLRRAAGSGRPAGAGCPPPNPALLRTGAAPVQGLRRPFASHRTDNDFPSLVRLMTQRLALDPGHKVLEIGTGSGYRPPRFCFWCRPLFERIDELARSAAAVLRSIGCDNVSVKAFDGTYGYTAARSYAGSS